MDTELLPCPYCGVVPLVGSSDDICYNEDGDYVWVYCGNAKCYAQGPCVPATTEDDGGDEDRRLAVAAWNRRPILSVLPVNEYILELGSSTYSNTDIILRRQPLGNGVDKWSIHSNDMRMSKQGTWDFEPYPSSRTQAFIDSHSFDSASEAATFYQEHRRKMKESEVL